MVDRDGLVFGGDGELANELIAADGNEVFPVGGVGQGGGAGGVWGGVSMWSLGELKRTYEHIEGRSGAGQSWRGNCRGGGVNCRPDGGIWTGEEGGEGEWGGV